MKASVSVILPTKNGCQTVNDTLTAVFQQKFDGMLEVLVIDSGSTDGTLDIVAQYPVRLHQIEPQDFSHGRTRNLGARLAGGDYLVYLTQDAIPTTDQWLNQLTSNLREDHVAGAYSRQIPRADTNSLQECYLSMLYPSGPRVVRRLETRDHVRLRDIFFSNVGSAIKRSVWLKHPFDETVVMSEDQHWAKRVMLDRYAIVYDPSATVHHSHNYDIIRVFQRNFDSGQSLRGLTDDTPSEAIHECVQYVKDEIQFLAERKLWHRIPYALAFELSRIAGFAIGNKCPFLRWGSQEEAQLQS